MGENEFIDGRFPDQVTKRSALILWAVNNFPYIMILPLAAVIFSLRLHWAWSVFLLLMNVLLVSLFWKLYALDLPLSEQRHPHHSLWGFLSDWMKPYAALVQNKQPWLAVLAVFWLTASVINLAAVQLVGERYLLGQYWLLYVPVVIWPSYKLKINATEWFAAAWLASVISYLAAAMFFLPGWIQEFWPDIVSPLVWYTFVSLFLHFLFRRMASFRGQTEALQKISAYLRANRAFCEVFDTHPVTSDPDNQLNQIAQMIGMLLRFERVYLHILDSEKGQLFMKGRYTPVSASWPTSGWPIEQREKASITGWAATHRKEHLCNDTAHCTLYFNQDADLVCRSEAAVPILVESECVGVIEIESSFRGAFDGWDVQILWQIANSIGAALAYERHVSHEVQTAYNLLEETVLKMASTRNLDEALAQVAKQARSLFHADLVTIYKHAVSTCVPLPGLVVEGEAFWPDLLGNHIPSNSRVNTLLGIKEDVYLQPYSDEDDFLLGPNQGVCTPEEALVLGHALRFVRREKIKSTVYIKLGVGREIVGSLFLNFRQRTFFQQQQIKALQAFAKTFALALILKRRVERVSGPLSGAAPLAHSQAEAAFESVSRTFNEINLGELSHCAESQHVLNQLEDFNSRLDRLKREWTNLILVEQRTLHSSSLAEPVLHLETKLRALFPGVRLKWSTQDFLAIPPDELGEVLYKVIAEAVSNALVHAEATEITVKSALKADSIQLSISNNGIAIDPDQAERMNRLVERPFRFEDLEKATGIVPILLDARRWFGATWQIEPLPGIGTSIIVNFPLGNKFTWQDEEMENGDET